jgi:hypothetical protein
MVFSGEMRGVAVALQDVLGRQQKTEEIEQVTLIARVMYKALLNLHYKRKDQKKSTGGDERVG